MGVEVLVAAALPLLHTKAGQRLAGQRLLVLVVAALPLLHTDAGQRLQQPKNRESSAQLLSVAFGASCYSRVPFLLVPSRDTAWWGHEEGGSTRRS